MRLVIVESPFARDPASMTAYARAAVHDCLVRGEAPFASHLLYTQVLNDSDYAERQQGMQAGWRWMENADLVALYSDYSFSGGMIDGQNLANQLGIPTEERHLPAQFMERFQRGYYDAPMSY